MFTVRFDQSEKVQQNTSQKKPKKLFSQNSIPMKEMNNFYQKLHCFDSNWNKFSKTMAPVKSGQLVTKTTKLSIIAASMTIGMVILSRNQANVINLYKSIQKVTLNLRVTNVKI